MVAKNVVIFGPTGHGKSSVVNMLLGPGSPKAETSSGAVGCTFKSQPFPCRIGETDCILYDTAGLDEGKDGTICSKEAFKNLCSLTQSLAKSGGVSLLIFVMRAGRLNDAFGKNYRLFYNGFCQCKVPIAIAITGLELQPNGMDSWWTKNKRYIL